MISVSATFVGQSPFGFSAPIQSPRNTGEAHDAYEERTWRERMHLDSEGRCFIQPTAIKNCLAECAKYLSESVPGKGKATYTKHFEAGLLVTDPCILLNDSGKPIVGEDVPPLRLFVPSDGKRGGGSRVWKNFPVIQKWQTKTTIYILDPILIDKPQKIHEYLEHAGKFIGLGFFRPRNNGYYGRFTVKDFKKT